MSGRLDVISCGVEPLSGQVREQTRHAEVIFASAGLLAACPETEAERRVIGPGAREQAREAVDLLRDGRRVVVLASGDALFHGFGGTLSGMLEDRDRPRVRFHPHITAFQALFHRLGLPWNEARLFSVHSGGGLPLRGILEAPLAVIYGGSAYPAHKLAARLAAFHPDGAARPGVIAENLGSPDERILRGTLESLAAVPAGPTSMLVLLAPQDADEGPALALGLAEDCYERENNLITSSEARPLILARLRLPARGVLWDVGAGSGAVGLEAAALRPGLRVLAVEKNPGRAAMIGRNRERLGVSNHELRLGDALKICADVSLPRPHRVFLGGGGKDLPALLDLCHAALAPGGLMAAVAVTLESVQRLYAWRPECRLTSCSLDVAVESPLAAGRHLRAQNRLTLCVFGKQGF